MRGIKLKNLTIRRLTVLASKGDVTEVLKGFASGPVPYRLRVGWRSVEIPQTLQELRKGLTYGQWNYLSTPVDNALEEYLRVFVGYFLPKYMGEPFTSPEAFTKKLRLFSRMDALDTIATCAHIRRLVEQQLAIEVEAYRTPTDPLWIVAGGDALAVFAPLASMDYLAEKLRCSPSDINGKPYNECFSWLAMRSAGIRVDSELNRLRAEQMKHKR